MTFKKGNKFGSLTKGRKHTEDARAKMSASHKGQVAWNKGIKTPQFSKENNPRWTGGSIGYWKRQALERDNHTCVVCGLREPEIMIVDHIVSKRRAPHLSRELTNLQTLCPNDDARKTKKSRDIHFGRPKKSLVPSTTIKG